MKIKWRQFFFFIILILLGLFIARNFGKFGQFVDLIKGLNLFVLVLIFPIRYMYYWASTRYYMHFFKLFDHDLKYKELFPGVISMNFLNTVVPSGGISGATFFAKQYEDKVTSRESFLAQFFWGLATLGSLVITLAASFVILFFSNAFAQISFRLVLFIISVLLGIAIVLVVITLNPDLFKKGLFIATRPVNWVLKLFKKNVLDQRQVDRFVDGYQDIINLFSKHPRQAIRPLVDAFICILVEVASIMVVFLAFGHIMSPGVVGAAYVLALLSSLVSVFTAGVGVYEATMVATLVALGAPFSLAFSATFVYRLVAMWLFIPVGLYFYKKQAIDDDNDPILKKKKKKKA